MSNKMLLMEQLVSRETAQLAAKKGFDEICEYMYSPDMEDPVENGKRHINSRLKTDKGPLEGYITAPTQDLLHRWLREECSLFISIVPTDSSLEKEGRYSVEVFLIDPTSHTKIMTSVQTLDTYEEAMEAGLEYALHLV